MLTSMRSSRTTPDKRLGTRVKAGSKMAYAGPSYRCPRKPRHDEGSGSLSMGLTTKSASILPVQVPSIRTTKLRGFLWRNERTASADTPLGRSTIRASPSTPPNSSVATRSTGQPRPCTLEIPMSSWAMQNETGLSHVSRNALASQRQRTTCPIPMDLPPSTRKKIPRLEFAIILSELRLAGINFLQPPVAWIEQKFVAQCQTVSLG